MFPITPFQISAQKMSRDKFRLFIIASRLMKFRWISNYFSFIRWYRKVRKFKILNEAIGPVYENIKESLIYDLHIILDAFVKSFIYLFLLFLVYFKISISSFLQLVVEELFFRWNLKINNFGSIEMVWSWNTIEYKMSWLWSTLTGQDNAEVKTNQIKCTILGKEHISEYWNFFWANLYCMYIILPYFFGILLPIITFFS